MSRHKSILQQFQQHLDAYGIKRITTVPVQHCLEAHGIVLEFKNAFKVTYSGDARPCQQLAQLGVNSDLFIHEATYSQDELQYAIQNNHTTIVEAVQLAMQANAKMCVLTHFSTRYSKISFKNDVLDADFCQFLFNNTICAYDHMQFTWSEAKAMPEVSKIVSEFYPNEEDE